MRDVVARTGIGPNALRHAGDAGDFSRQARRDAGVAPEGAPDQLQRALFDRALSLRRCQPLADTRVGASGMQNAFDSRHFLATLLRGSRRHHGFLVPVQATGYLAQRLGIALECHQVGERSHVRAPAVGCVGAPAFAQVQYAQAHGQVLSYSAEGVSACP